MRKNRKNTLAGMLLAATIFGFGIANADLWDQKNVGFTDTMRSTDEFEKGMGVDLRDCLSQFNGSTKK